MATINQRLEALEAVKQDKKLIVTYLMGLEGETEAECLMRYGQDSSLDYFYISFEYAEYVKSLV